MAFTQLTKARWLRSLVPSGRTQLTPRGWLLEGRRSAGRVPHAETEDCARLQRQPHLEDHGTTRKNLAAKRVARQEGDNVGTLIYDK